MNHNLQNIGVIVYSIYYNKYLRRVVIDPIDIFMMSLIVSLCLIKLLKNRFQAQDKKKAFDYKLVDDLKRQSKKLT